MLANGNEVCDVIARLGSNAATPAAPFHKRPSAKTTAADAPGTPVTFTSSRSRATVVARPGPDAGRARSSLHNTAADQQQEQLRSCVRLRGAPRGA